MEQSNRSGLRELQIAKGLVTLRWAAVPIILGFAMLATRGLGMSFNIIPIYLLCCLTAIFNVFFTFHISVLSRQLLLRRGTAALKRYLLALINHLQTEISQKGIFALLSIPQIIFRLFYIFFLFLLETLKGVRFNLLSLDNITHTQILGDILILILLVRYTGSPESPLIVLTIVPVIVAGAVLGFQTAGIYATLATAAYLALCLMINARLLTHIKFYGPQIGDLSNSIEWTITSSLSLLTALLGSAYLAHNLTSVFKERIFFLNQLLEKNRHEERAFAAVADATTSSWFLLDANGNILKYKPGKLILSTEDLIGKNILDSIPPFKQYDMGYVIQSVATSRRIREIKQIKFQTREGTSHILSCRLIPLVDNTNLPLVLLMVEDVTEISYLRERADELKKSLDSAQIALEKSSIEWKEINQQLMKTLKLADDRFAEIEKLKKQVQELESKNLDLNNQVFALQSESAELKTANNTLAADLNHKQTILEEVIELLQYSTQLDALVALIERRIKSLFKLDNTCLHIFRSPAVPNRMNEILDTRKASPRLLDFPRKNPKVLESVLNDGLPVIIKAEVHPDQTASVAITNRSMQRLVGYIPVRYNKELLGIMMLERFGPEENPDRLINMLTYYLSNASIALKNAIAARTLEIQQQNLETTIKNLDTQIEGLLELSRISALEDDQPFKRFLCSLGKTCGATDGAIVRVHSDGTIQPLARLDSTKQLELRPLEGKLFKTLQANPANKAVIKEAIENITLLGYPLIQGARLIGALFLQIPCFDLPLQDLVDVAAQLAAEKLGIYILNEEKELWNEFYKTNLSA